MEITEISWKKGYPKKEVSLCMSMSECVRNNNGHDKKQQRNKQKQTNETRKVLDKLLS